MPVYTYFNLFIIIIIMSSKRNEIKCLVHNETSLCLSPWINNALIKINQTVTSVNLIKSGGMISFSIHLIDPVQFSPCVIFHSFFALPSGWLANWQSDWPHRDLLFLKTITTARSKVSIVWWLAKDEAPNQLQCIKVDRNRQRAV